ncbi:MAG TPA: CDP-diacylglycerol diphosphatase [Caulobacteraceae bacterium]|jgi:CDP-diacylglycerol pyrophosphatase
MRRVIFLILVAGLAFGVSASPTSAPHSMALWRVVHALCVTDMKVSGHPAPCLEVNPDGYVVLRDLKARTEVLLVPTVRLIGIESPELQAPESPNYWQAAWEARRYLDMRTGAAAPREDIGLVVNSIFGRSQDQLHIHVDCVLPEVVASLAAHRDEIGDAWTPLSFKLAGKTYRARRLDGEDFGDRDPFKLLARGDPEAGADMSRQTLAAVGVRGVDGRPGFVLLAATGGTLENPDGASEALLDHSCAVLDRSPGALSDLDQQPRTR